MSANDPKETSAFPSFGVSCDGISTSLNSASIEGRNDWLWGIHIPRCRHRRCDTA
jgi:hypothetical protein